MRQQTINTGQAYARAEHRDRRVRKLTFWSVVLLGGLSLAAIWQDRDLAPPLHDALTTGVAFALDTVKENEALSEVLAELQDGYEDLVSGS